MKIRATTADAYRLFHDGALALARAERQGIRVDTEYCEQERVELTRKILLLREELESSRFYRRWVRIYGTKTNLDSDHQLAHVLYRVLKITPPKTTATGAGSTDEEALAQIDIPELKAIIQIRKLAKVRDTYLGAFIREQYDGYLHPGFDLHTVRTYRSSSSGPNFQNIPMRDEESMRICRRALLPRPGHQLAELDFAAMEIRISACYHKDPVMLRYLEDPSSDMHLDLAKQIFCFNGLDRSLPAHYTLRQAAKNGFIFPQFYGDYHGNNVASICEWIKLPRGRWKPGMGIQLPDGVHISDHLRGVQLDSFERFTEHIKAVEDDFWSNRFKIYNAWREAWVAQYRRRGHLKMLTGFVVSGEMRKNQIINSPIQGTAFHCLLFTFIRLDEIMRKERWRSKLIGQIHDSIVMDVHPDELPRVEEVARRIVKEELSSRWDWIIVPMDVDLEVYEVDGPWVHQKA